MCIDAWRLIEGRPAISALLLGLFSATGFQPIGLWPLALAAMAMFVALIAHTPTARRATVLGWLFGFAHFTLGNSWIATAFTYQSNMPAILGWAAVPLLSLYLAVYPALAAFAAHRLVVRKNPWALSFAFAGAWIVTEWLRSWVFTGYPWNPFGIVLLGGFERPGLAALAPWLGTYALSGAAVLLSGAAWALWREGHRWPLFASALLVTTGMYLPPDAGREGGQEFTLVQPDIRQEVLNDPAFYESNFIKTVELTGPSSEGEDRIVLWPESGVPDYLRQGYPQRYYDATTAMGDPGFARRRIGGVIGADAVLLTGATDLEIGEVEGVVRAVGARNVVTALDGGGSIIGSYAKAHLVPYGEYLPLRPFLEPLGLSRLVPGAIDFWPGPGPRTLDLGEKGRAGIQICYEIIFSGHVVDGSDRPDFIFNPSNDGWFGAFGPPQHLAQARLRAIEEGLPVLRATTTGISAVIDARGVVRDQVPMHVAGVMEGRIPPAHSPTLFALTGNYLPIGWAVLFILLAVVAMRRRDEIDTSVNSMH